MPFNVVFSELAEKQYDTILSYVANTLKNRRRSDQRLHALFCHM